jgi:hypothetical protein
MDIKKKKLHAIEWGLLALIPLLFVILVIHSCSPRENQENLTVINQGERTMGTITSTEDYLGYEEGDEFTVEYSFTTSSEQALSGQYIFPQSYSSDLNTGGQLEIAFDAQDPARNLPVMAKEKESAFRGRVWLGIIIVTLVLCGSAGFLGYLAWEAWRLHY